MALSLDVLAVQAPKPGQFECGNGPDIPLHAICADETSTDYVDEQELIFTYVSYGKSSIYIVKYPVWIVF